MLKKIGLTALFAITVALGVGTAQARTISAKAPGAPVPQGFCPAAACH